MKKFTFLILATFMLLVTSVHSQVTQTGNTALTTNPTEYVGYDGLGTFNRSLDIKNLFGNYNINFWTNNGTTTTQKMTILGSSGSDDGYVGIGTTTPNRLLQIHDGTNGGQINLSGPTGSGDGSSYRINDDRVLLSRQSLLFFTGTLACSLAKATFLS